MHPEIGPLCPGCGQFAYAGCETTCPLGAVEIEHKRWIPWRLAVDVGVQGCVVALNVETKELKMFELPYAKRPLVNPRGKRKFESVPMPHEWLDLFEPYSGARIISEDLAAIAGNFAFSEGQLMESFGMVQMACAAKKIDFYTVHPNTWKAFMLRGRGGMKAEKSESVKLARQLCPCAEQVLLRSKDGRADAINILYYDLLGERKRMEMKALKLVPVNPIHARFLGLN